tara:strand:- start:194 stop:433 length:240 start_codon:yes stop_codon:yes gene_type:complete
MTKQEIKTKLKNINSKLKRLLNEMNSDPEDIDKLFDCIQVISLKYELSQRKKVYEDWQRQKPVEYKDVLILKKEWEVKQ